MLPRVAIGRHSASMRANVDRYRPLVGDGLMDEVSQLARELSGVRICHVNSTAYGGGVAELLSRYLPLIQGLGISAEWRLIHGALEFFAVTKAFHNALQGAHYDLPKSAQTLYLGVNEESAELLDANYDVIVVHDPQPAAIRHFAGRRNAKWKKARETRICSFSPMWQAWEAWRLMSSSAMRRRGSEIDSRRIRPSRFRSALEGETDRSRTSGRHTYPVSRRL